MVGYHGSFISFKNQSDSGVRYMRKIPESLRAEMANDPYYKRCARFEEGNCSGRITWEHAIIYAGKQLNEKWAIIPICEYHHAVDNFQDRGNLNKEKHIWIALNRATDSELLAVSKAINYIRLRNTLNEKYGDYAFG